MAQRELLYAGIKRHVVALDRSTGEEVWRTHLKGVQFVNVTLERGLLLAGTRGEIFALTPDTGRIVWNNSLKGMGYGIVSFRGSSPTPAAEQEAEESAAASSG
jgi:outer membrane protein assembly factor BamB